MTRVEDIIQFSDPHNNKNNKLTKHTSKQLDEILNKYWDKPNEHIQFLCNYWQLDFNYYMDFWLDCYNLKFKQMYKRHGEDSTLPAIRKALMEECLVNTWQEMEYDLNEYINTYIE
jgi:hypothetical protein